MIVIGYLSVFLLLAKHHTKLFMGVMALDPVLIPILQIRIKRFMRGSSLMV